MDQPPTGHDAVLPKEVLQTLQPRPGMTVVDCTIGRAGHAAAIAAELGPTGLLVGLDVDPRNLEFARERLKQLPCPARLFHANFADLKLVLEQVGKPQVNVILADLGLSTNQ